MYEGVEDTNPQPMHNYTPNNVKVNVTKAIFKIKQIANYGLSEPRISTLKNNASGIYCERTLRNKCIYKCNIF